MTRRSSRLLLAIAAAAALAVALWWRAGAPPAADRVASAPSTGAAPAVPIPPPTGPAHAAAPTSGTGTPAARDDLVPEPPETAWAAVDLDAIREVMPDNLFWKMAVPTRDPEILAQRAKERERWNTEYGKVLSGNATAEEIDTYYAERQQLAQDYVEFATYLLAEYGDELTVRDVGLLKVAVELNLARLEQFPRDLAEAQARREQHDAARRAWREQQRAFEDAPIN
jgi:hypothetical protein